MGILVQGKELWRALFTRTRRRVIGLLFGFPDRSFYANEVVRLAGVGTGSVQRELVRLAGAGLLKTTRIGNQVHYQADRDSPFFPELHAMVMKTHGIIQQLRLALRQTAGPPAHEITFAFLYGPGAEQLTPEPLQIFLVAAGMTRAEIVPELEKIAQSVDREVTLTLLSPARFDGLLQAGDEGLKAVLAAPRVMLSGHLDLERERQVAG